MIECAKCHRKITQKSKQFIGFADAYLCKHCGFEWRDLWGDKFGDSTVSFQQATDLFCDFIVGIYKSKFIFR